MAVVRAMAITYGAQAVPGTVAGANVTLHSVHKLRKDATRFELEFDLLVDGLGSEATLSAAAIALEATFTTRRLALTVDLGGTNALTVSDTNRSGFDVTPTIEKVENADSPDRFDTNTSRLYRVRFEAGLPSLGTGNLAEFGYDVSFSPSRRTELTVRGTYSATEGGSSSSANYLGLIAGRVAAITGALAGTFEKVSERYSPDDVDGFTAFEQVHKQVLFNQSTGTLDNPAVVDPNLSITRTEVTDEGTGDGVPLLELEAKYGTSVDFDVNSNLVTVWETISLPLVLSEMESVAGSGIAITELSPSFDYYNHTISAVVRGQAVGQSGLLKKSIETLDETDFGKIIREVWPASAEIKDDEKEASPSPTPAHVYQSARVISRTITTITEEVSADIDSQRGARNNRVGQQQDHQVWVEQDDAESTYVSVLMTRSTRSKRKKRGVRDQGEQIDVLERTIIETYRIVIGVPDAVAGDTAIASNASDAASNVGGNAGEGGSGGRR